MGTHGFYRFDAGINYRDRQKAVNELSTGENLRWYEDALTRRLGYQLRATALDVSPAFSAGSCLNILDHLYYKDGSTERDFLFVSVDAGGGSVADKVVVFHAAALPSTATAAFVALGSTYAMDWTATDAFDTAQKLDKVYICTDDDNPHVLYLDGTAWKTQELPLCDNSNGGGSNGYTAGDAIIISADWDGCQWVEVADVALYLCDGKRMFWAGCYDYNDDPAIDIDSTALATRMAGVTQVWDPAYYDMVDLCRPFAAGAYRSYIMMAGEQKVWRFLGRDLINNDTFLDEIADVRVRGELKACIAGVFWVSDDGIYFFNGQTSHNISGKIWEHIKSQHATFPAGLDTVSIAYFQGWIWISFPSSTDKEIWVFNPRSTYQAPDGQLYATFYKYIYKITDLTTKKAFSVLRVIQDRLFATDGANFYELETGYLDIDQGINTVFETANFDFEAPNKKKVYGDSVLECDANLEITLSHVLTFTRDYGEETETITGIDTTYASAQRAHVENRIPYGVDGNAMRVKVAGTAPSASAGTGEVRYYGVSVDATVQSESKIERS